LAKNLLQILDLSEGIVPALTPGTACGKVETRIAQAERLLAKGSTHGQAVRRLREEHGISKTTAERTMRALYLRWQREASTQDREKRRNQMRAMLMGGAREALQARKYESFAKCAELLCRLDGILDQPETTAITVNVRTEVLSVLERHYGAKAVIEAEGESVPAKLTNGHGEGSNGHG
jgi:hypothetical protein